MTTTEPLFDTTPSGGLDGVLMIRRGQVVVRTTWSDWTYPTRTSQFWGPLWNGPDVEHVQAMGLEGRLARHLPGGGFDIAGWGVVRLPKGGSTERLWVERQPVPPPRTRCETRWYQGRWEKVHAKRGWVPA